MIVRKQNLQTEAVPENSPTECKNERQNWILTNLKFQEKNRLWPSMSVQHYPTDSLCQLDQAALITSSTAIEKSEYCLQGKK